MSPPSIYETVLVLSNDIMKEPIMYTGGTPEAINFLEKYKRLGYVVDVYSDEYIKSLGAKAAFTSKDLKRYDELHGTKYRGHLLLIYVGDQESEVCEELRLLYEPIDRYFKITGLDGHWLIGPDLFIVNLNTQEILCVGLGRKYDFSFELNAYLTASTLPENPLQQVFHREGFSSECSNEFFALDHAGVIRKILSEFESLADAYFYDRKRDRNDALRALRKFARIDTDYELSN
jgi:hypothetical protein